MTINISKICHNGSGLDVEWSDGEKSNFIFDNNTFETRHVFQLSNVFFH